MPWEKAKAFDGSCLIGDWIKKSDFNNVDDINFKLTKNKEIKIYLSDPTGSALYNYIKNGELKSEGGFDKYINLNSDVVFLGKENLKKIKSQGVKKKLMGVQIDAKSIAVSGSIDLKALEIIEKQQN